MRVVLDRFKPPGPSDEKAACVCCGEWFHYEDLNEDGRCPNCVTDEGDDDE